MKTKSFLILILLCAVVQEAIAQTWTSGNTTCTLADGVFTVSPIAGTDGVMRDYQYQHYRPWYEDEYTYLVTRVVVEDGVTVLGKYAFQNFQNLTSVTLPNSLREIHAYAFDNCILLQSITIPVSVTKVEASVFHNCQKLTDVYCRPNAANISWDHDNYQLYNDFITDPMGATKMHVAPSQLAAFQEKFSGDNALNVTFVGDMSPSGNWTDAGNYSSSFREEGRKIYIDSEADLARMAYQVNSSATEYIYYTFVLTRDLDMSAHYWVPCGNFDVPFRASFDGQGHTIYGIHVNQPNADYNGLFGYYYTTTINNEEIKNVVLKNCTIIGRNYTGSVVGRIANKKISNVVSFAVVNGADNVGGIVGNVFKGAYNSPTTVKNCLYMGNSVTGNNNVAAVIGQLDSSDVECSNNYYTDASLNGLSDNDVRAYKATKGSLPAGVDVSISSPSSVTYDGNFYAPDGAAITITAHYNGLETIISGLFVNGEEITASPDGKYNFTLHANDSSDQFVVTATAASTGITGDGTETNPYVITTVSSWDAFATLVSQGVSCSGKYVQLGADITVTTMVGTNGKPFSGTFNGNKKKLTINYNTSEEYTAPFRFVDGANIHDLIVDGTINTSGMYAAGIIARISSSTKETLCHISNCHVSTAINSSVDDEGSHGGLVAYIGGNTTISGCLFDGSLLGSSTNECGGFVGWMDNQFEYVYVTIEECLFAPAELTMTGSNTFVRAYDDNEDELAITNCFYTQPLDDPQGTQLFSISGDTDVTVECDGTVASSYDVSGLTFYDAGLMYNNTLYAANGEQVSVNLNYTGTANTDFKGFIATAGTLSGTGNPYTLLMSEADVVIYFDVLIPANLNVQANLNSATVNWTPAAEETKWNIRYKPLEDGDQGWTAIDNVTDNSCLLAGLSPDTSYEVQVQAIYSEDITSAWTPSTTFVTGTTPPTITVDHVTDKSAHIAWTLPGNEEGCTYNLRYAPLSSMARVTLTVDFEPSDDTGYQMLLDADATAYGDIIPTNGIFCGENVPEGLYDAFEYKIPKNADSNLNTSNIVLNNSVTIDIPAGTYDWCIINPVPTWGIYFASANGNISGRYDDFVFEAGKHYTFTVSEFFGEDGYELVNLTTDYALDDWIDISGISDVFHNMNSLTANTFYGVQVQTVYSNGKISEWSPTVYFTTFEEGYVPTTITNIPVSQDAGSWYSVSGIKLNGKPTRPGIYLHNGKKTVIY